MQVAGLLNIVGAFLVAVFFLGLYFRRLGPQAIEGKLSRIPLLLYALLVCFLLLSEVQRRFPEQMGAIAAPFYLFENFLWFMEYFLHEAGHIYWAPLGRTAAVLGGTLNELLVPLVIVGYCLVKRHFCLGGLLLYFLAYNLSQVARYMQSAQSMTDSLVKGHGIHDWHFLFAQWELGPKIGSISGVVSALSALSATAALGLLFFVLFRRIRSLGAH